MDENLQGLNRKISANAQSKRQKCKWFEVKQKKNYEKKNYTKSIQLFEKILKLNPNNSDAIINKALCLAELGKYEDSLEYLEIVLKKNPNDFDALYNKATTLYDMDRYKMH